MSYERGPKASLAMVFDQPPPPCEVFSCNQYENCKKKLLACESFYHYTITGKALPPDTAWKKRVGIIKTKKKPTHMQFLKIFRYDEDAPREGEDMQRKATKNTRGPNTKERKFASWVKWRPCCVCGKPEPSIVDHAMGATYKHAKVLIGHWFLLPLCRECDSVKTFGSRRAFTDKFGKHSDLWLELIKDSPVKPPWDVVDAIRDCGK